MRKKIHTQLWQLAELGNCCVWFFSTKNPDIRKFRKGPDALPPPPHPSQKVSTPRVLEFGVPERKGFHGGEVTHRGMGRAPTHPPHRHSADGETFQKVSPWTRFTETTERFPRRQGDRVNVSPPPICAPQSRRRGNLSKPPGKMFPRLNGGPEIAQFLVT